MILIIDCILIYFIIILCKLQLYKYQVYYYYDLINLYNNSLKLNYIIS